MNFCFKTLGVNYETRKTINSLIKIGEKNNTPLFFTGGIVRDSILKKENYDIDLFTTELSLEFVSTLEKEFKTHFKLVPQFYNAMAKLKNGVEIDLSYMRKEKYPYCGALPLVEKGTFIENILRRDFSINALIFSDKKILDPFNALRDLKKRELKIMYPLSFFHDPTRILRGIRFSLRFGYNFEKNTEKYLAEALDNNYLLNISDTRFLRELSYLFLEENIEKLFINKKYKKICEHLFGELNFKLIENFFCFFKKNSKLLKKLSIKREDIFPLTIFIINFSKNIKEVSSEINKKSGTNYNDKRGEEIFIKFLNRFNPLDLSCTHFSKYSLKSLYNIRKSDLSYRSELFKYFENFNSHELFLFIFFNKDNRELYGKVVTYLSIKNIKPLITGKTLISLGIEPNKNFSIFLERFLFIQLDKKIVEKNAMLQEVMHELQYK